jgi:hypothetical protein
MVKIASLAKARIMRLFMEIILKFSERNVEPTLNWEEEIYVRQEARVLSTDGTE